ncbi:MAG: hypothetical protein H7A24_01105 [Leptospiraceae bacterium]|nr:hypothetical protein [Leptospiraceae bacterium]MCP5510450.1 hypothetical protein [Leptospiraceae bacterium]
MKKYIFLFLSLGLVACSNADSNKVKTDVPPEILPYLSTDTNYYALYFRDREIDSTLTSNCGEASRGVTSSTTGTTGTTGTTSTGSSSQSNTRYIILNKYVIKDTGESLNLKFNYDTYQTSGSIDQQQGFTLTGGVFNATITGRQGTVEWAQGGTSLGYLDETSTRTQYLTYMKDVKVTLFGTFKRESTTSTVVPFECYTTDNVNCTTTITTSKCFTQDNKTCLVTSLTDGIPITFTATINCETSNFITN